MPLTMLLNKYVYFFVSDAQNRLGGDQSIWAKAIRGDNLEARPWRSYAYSEKQVATQAHWQALEPLLRLPGASAGAKAQIHYTVETSVSPTNDAELNAWYDQEHLPGLASVPGTIMACRFRRVLPNGAPTYIACYDLESAAVLESEPWLAVRKTAWSDNVRPMFVNPRRTLYSALA